MKAPISSASGQDARAILQNRLMLIERHFLNPGPRYGIGWQGSHGASAVCTDFVELLRGHLGFMDAIEVSVQVGSESSKAFTKVGKFRVGLYSQDQNGLTKWMCIDIDGPGHAKSVADPEGVARKLQEFCLGQGIPAYLERSGGGKGWHLWVFFDQPVSIRKARTLGIALAPKDVRLERGAGLACPEKNQGIEIFPKQFEAESFGNYVWVPWWSKSPQGANQFYQAGDSGKHENFEPTEFETISERALDLVIGKLASIPREGKVLPRQLGAPRVALDSTAVLTADAETIVAECRFLRHCVVNQKELGEEYWYSAASILGKTPGGREAFHAISEGYPGYDRNEADKKFRHAKAAPGPRTCADISQRWDGCDECPHFGKVSSAAQIGIASKARVIVQAMIAEVDRDPGAPFEPQVLAALRWLNSNDAPEFIRTKSRLKEAGISLNDLKSSLKIQTFSSRGVDPGARYSVHEGKLSVRVRKEESEYWNPLCNFDARIVSEEVHDDGIERRSYLTIEGALATGAPLAKINVPADDFSGMAWPMKHWGARAILFAGSGVKDHARAGVQSLSDAVKCTDVFIHTGWRETPGQGWVFLTAEGAIGKNGSAPEIRVRLTDGRMSAYRLDLPSDQDELRRCVVKSLDLLNLVPWTISVPLLGAIYRAPLGEAITNDQAVFLVGKTGSFKSEIASIAQAHFGKLFNGRNLPANWSSTGNALERQAFLAKDVVLVVDDYSPRGTVIEVQKLNQTADRLFRGLGNGSGRDRLYSTGQLRPQSYSRAVIVATGEDVPRGHSLRARLLIVDIKPDSIDCVRLTELQDSASEGVFSKAMAGYVRWLAGQMDELKTSLPTRRSELRKTVVKNIVHRRTPDLVVDLSLGFEIFVRYAIEIQAIAPEEGQRLLSLAGDALAEVAHAQDKYLSSEDPCERFVELLEAALASEQAYVAKGLGGNSAHYAGVKLGWMEKGELCLNPDVALSVANRMMQGQVDGLALSKQALGKLLAERGFILSEPEKNTVQRGPAGQRGRVWAFPNPERLFSPNFFKKLESEGEQQF